VSDAAGAVPDLVEEGGTGMVFPAGDRAALRCCLGRLLADASLRTQLGEGSLERIQRWSHHHSTESVLRALEFATGARPRTYTP
ncbi:MAG: glycosyltransferase, partial [Candidatus Acidiferrales bacterium]